MDHMGELAAQRAARRTELAAYLRACRERITPDAVGLPPGARRRTPGLRREEVVNLAGVGVTWYTWLEQGRPINASEQVVDAIARTLRLTSAERDHLFHLAELPPPDSVGSTGITDEIQEILDALDPLPAALTNGRYDLLGWNAPYAAVFGGFLCDATRLNSLWCIFTRPACCSPMANPDDYKATMVATLRSGYGRHVGEPEWESFLAELRSASPTFAQMWAEQHVSAPGPMSKVFRHAAVGEIRATTTSLAVTGSPENRIVVYRADDEESRERFAWLRAHPHARPTLHDHHLAVPMPA
jgi:MmyB-like transcription regulator ligand binding domain/Helix-turn-helix domain